jgi:hypothetical protein
MALNKTIFQTKDSNNSKIKSNLKEVNQMRIKESMNLFDQKKVLYSNDIKMKQNYERREQDLEKNHTKNDKTVKQKLISNDFNSSSHTLNSSENIPNSKTIESKDKNKKRKFESHYEKNIEKQKSFKTTKEILKGKDSTFVLKHRNHEHWTQCSSRKYNEQLKITVIIGSGLESRKIDFDVNSFDTVSNLKKKIEEITGFDSRFYRLISSGKRLLDNNYLCDYNLKNGDNIFAGHSISG